jgi:hypothetical protein
LCREDARNDFQASSYKLHGSFCPTAIVLQEEIANRCMLLLRKRVRRGCFYSNPVPYVNDSIRFTEVPDDNGRGNGFRLAHDR